MNSAVVVQEVCKGDESLEDEVHSGWPSEVDNNQLGGSSKPILSQLNEKMLKNSTSTILWSCGIWSKLERWKSSISGCLISWPQIKKIIILKCHLLLFLTTMNHFSNGLWYVKSSGLYMTTSDDQLHGWAKKKPQSTLQSRTCTKKGHGHCLVVCAGLIPYSFLNPGETITSERHAQRLMTCTEHCNACSWH